MSSATSWTSSGLSTSSNIARFASPAQPQWPKPRSQLGVLKHMIAQSKSVTTVGSPTKGDPGANRHIHRTICWQLLLVKICAVGRPQISDLHLRLLCTSHNPRQHCSRPIASAAVLGDLAGSGHKVVRQEETWHSWVECEGPIGLLILSNACRPDTVGTGMTTSAGSSRPTSKTPSFSTISSGTGTGSSRWSVLPLPSQDTQLPISKGERGKHTKI